MKVEISPTVFVRDNLFFALWAWWANEQVFNSTGSHIIGLFFNQL